MINKQGNEANYKLFHINTKDNPPTNRVYNGFNYISIIMIME